MSCRWYRYFKHEFKYNDVLEEFTSHYEYMDKSVKILSADIPMPPTDDFSHLFECCEKLQDISALANWDVYNVKNMCGMFQCCEKLQDISALADWDVSRVENMGVMFAGCKELKDVTALSKWDVSNVKSMYSMFCNCHQLQNITALANWNFSHDDKEVFYGCTLLPRELQINPFYMHTYLSKQL